MEKDEGLNLGNINSIDIDSEPNTEPKSNTASRHGQQDIVDLDLDEIDQYLEAVDDQVNLGEVDDLLDEIGDGLDLYDEEIKNADDETKRDTARQNRGAHVVDSLARDKDDVTRILAFCNEDASPATLAWGVEHAGSDDKFTLMVIANNKNTSNNTLHRIFDLAGDEKEVRAAILKNPNCDDVLKFKVESVTKK